ncbi:MAG: hypothetical protein JO222_06250 [Frankiales bacterium]|nr:hypothetical protein [Frankiales bacterium]
MLRRLTAITTSYAPTLGAPLHGAPQTPQRPAPVEDVGRLIFSDALAAQPAAADPPPSTGGEASWYTAPRNLDESDPTDQVTSPSWTPGVCYHAAHVRLSDGRYGLLPDSTRDPVKATLLRCPHFNADGR